MYNVSPTLQLHYNRFPQAVDQGDRRTWIFGQQLDKQPSEFFLPILHQHDIFRLEYEVLQTQLDGLLNDKEDIKKYESQLITALMIAETLQYNYRHFYGVKRDTEYFQQETELLKMLLGEIGYVFPDRPISPPLPFSEWHVGKTIRDKTANWNVIRQAIQRSRKFIIETDSFINSLKVGPWIERIDKTASPILNILALLFFLPRTAYNLWMLGKHVLPGQWMEERELSLRWDDRLTLQLKRRGFELGDDLVWCVVNISLCFLLVGPLAPWVGPMIMAQQICEVFSRVAKLLSQIGPLMNLRHHYLAQLENENLDKNTRQDIRSYLDLLDKRIEFQIKMLSFNLFCSSTILVLSLTTLALFTVFPWIPVVSTGLIVAMTGVFYYANKAMAKSNPNNPLDLTTTVSRLGIFSPNKKNEDTDVSNTDPNLIFQ